MKEDNSEDLSREKEPRPKARKLSKTPTTFHVKLTEEQKRAKAVALDSTITFLTGKQGTAKTLLTCQIALDLLISGQVGKIIVTRPTVNVGEEDIGFLPGDAFDFKSGKMAPYITPILDAMYKLRSQDEIDKLIEKKCIEILPILFVRGRNFDDCVVIIDESQNVTAHEMKALTSRICPGSKMIFTADVGQVDLIRRNLSAGRFIAKIIKLPNVGTFELTQCFRDPLAILISDLIDEELEEEYTGKLKAA